MGPLLALAVAAFSATADPPKPLTAEERKALEDEGRERITAGMKAQEKGELAAARKAFERSVGICRRLHLDGPTESTEEALVGTLNLLASVQLEGQEFADAEASYREVLGLRQQRFPGRDHDFVASSLNALAVTLAARGKLADAEPLYRDTLAMRQRLDPRQDGVYVAQSLNNLAALLMERGKLADAEPLYRDALGMWERLYAKRDNLYAADVRANLANLLAARGRWADAEPLSRDALSMRQRLYPKQDHPDVAASMSQLASVLEHRGQLEDAETEYRKALAMWQRVFGKEDHADVVAGQSHLAGVLVRQGRPADATSGYRDALAMCRRLYPKQDHPHTARSLLNLGVALQVLGELAAAEEHSRDALAMCRRLHPDRAHPDVVAALHFAADVLLQRGKSADANLLYREGLAMNRRVVEGFARRAAEGDALTLATQSSNIRDGYLSNALALESKPADVYAEMFADRGSLSRVYEQKQLKARAAATDPTAATLLSELADARIRRAEMLLAPATKDEATLKKREEELKAFEKTIADKSTGLSERFTPVARIEKLVKASPADLQKALPEGAVVVDLLKWTHFEYDAKTPGKGGQKQTPKYLAFVVTKADVRWLDLGPADTIEEALKVWREAITDSAHAVPADVGVKVRERVWGPIRKELPKGTKEVYISPDAALCRLPWVALPGDKPGTVVLEDELAVATIPHAPFLLDHLWERDTSTKARAETLVVGGVDFDARPTARLDPKAPQPDLLLDPKAKPWGELKGTKTEADGLLKLAKEQKRDTTAIAGAAATPAAVLAALPKARHAHLATHGFFADTKFRSAFQLDEKDYLISRTNERVGRAANSPLVMSGLVLAGANDPKTPGRGIVTGEALIDLDLSGMELAVLSACETGLGDVAGGEGTFGLQRAFHTAGTRNVVASLWSVSDAATAALMGEFYRHLWAQKRSPLQALKAAQLKVYRTDRKEFAALALRGFKASDVPDTPEKNFPPAPGDGVRNHPALWAAFSLSGPGK